MISFESFKTNELLANFSTFRLGGPADYCIEVTESSTLIQVLQFCRENHLKYHVIGKGSNSLFPDRGFRGLAIINKIDFIQGSGPLFKVGAGFSFSLLGFQTARLGYSGLEFASGIPASVGGAVYMNAGANGKETCDSLKSVEFLSEEGQMQVFSKEELTFGYRKSSFQTMKGVIISADFELTPCLKARERQLKIIEYRKASQPLKDHSVGCVFQNPKIEGCVSAGALIEQCGLKGVSIGGAKISEKHANFIVHTGNGKSEDVLQLIAFVKKRVKEATGIELQEEIKMVQEHGQL